MAARRLQLEGDSWKVVAGRCQLEGGSSKVVIVVRYSDGPVDGSKKQLKYHKYVK